jgi:hypothetical protein
MWLALQPSSGHRHIADAADICTYVLRGGHPWGDKQVISGIERSNTYLVSDAGRLTKVMIPAIYLNGVFVTTKCLLNG